MLAMKWAALVAFLAAHLPSCASRDTPMDKVVALLASLKTRVEEDGKAEQKSYDKYACWCEDTLGRKASDIDHNKGDIASLEETIKKTKAELASHTAEIAELKKQIAANIESQREATEVREKESAEYGEEKAESEQCIGALEAAIKVLNGAGTKKGFLETLQEAQLIGVVSGIKSVLRQSYVTRRFTDSELDAVKRFADKPEDFVGGRVRGVTALQVENNPFGDYAPQSTQIQGILKGMYDAFTGDLEKDNVEEANKQKAFEALIATKKTELATLESTLEKQELDAATATKLLADSKEALDDTKEELEKNEAFFAESKEACQTKAEMWAERTRLRTEELSGMAQAIEILSSPDSKKTFESATTTFLQLKRVSRHEEANSDRMQAFAQLKALATKYQSIQLGRLAVAVKTANAGHFDKVIAMIDTMIGMMRQEEREDIMHRDRCEAKQNANANSMDDLDASITKTKEALSRMGNEKDALDEKLKTAEGDIATTKKAMDDLLDMRNKEESDFKQALKDDSDAVALLAEAISALTKFYKENDIPMLIQKKKAPEYAEDPDKAPETSFDDGKYGGRKGESSGIVAILGMLKEDLEKEMKTGRADEAAAQEAYVGNKADLKATLDAQEKAKADIEESLAALEAKITEYEAFKDQKKGDLDAESDVKKSLDVDCEWVANTFDKRREKRKLEMDGLVEAKNFLAGVDSGEAVLPVNP